MHSCARALAGIAQPPGIPSVFFKPSITCENCDVSLTCAYFATPSNKVMLNADGVPAMLVTQCMLPLELPPTRPTTHYPEGELQHLTRIIMQPINTAGPR